ncbi:MAG: hypothetical protein AB4352_15620 [Hormoscilla sp.]
MQLAATNQRRAIIPSLTTQRFFYYAISRILSNPSFPGSPWECPREALPPVAAMVTTISAFQLVGGGRASRTRSRAPPGNEGKTEDRMKHCDREVIGDDITAIAAMLHPYKYFFLKSMGEGASGPQAYL